MSIPVLPEFVRWTWKSLPIRETWAPKLAKARHEIRIIERLAVLEGVVPHIYHIVPVKELPNEAQTSLEYGLTLLPLEGLDKNKRPTKNHAEYYRCLITRPDSYSPILGLIKNIGPTCCQIAENARNEESVDSTYEQLRDTVGTPGLASTLWRPLGLRLVPHQPCSYSCEASIQLAKDIILLAEKKGFAETTDTIQEVLSWPFKYSRLFGIVEVVTPNIRLYSRSNWTPTKDTYEVAGPPKVFPLTLHRKS